MSAGEVGSVADDRTTYKLQANVITSPGHSHYPIVGVLSILSVDKEVRRTRSRSCHGNSFITRGHDA